MCWTHTWTCTHLHSCISYIYHILLPQEEKLYQWDVLTDKVSCHADLTTRVLFLEPIVEEENHFQKLPPDLQTWLIKYSNYWTWSRLTYVMFPWQPGFVLSATISLHRIGGCLSWDSRNWTRGLTHVGQVLHHWPSFTFYILRQSHTKSLS